MRPTRLVFLPADGQSAPRAMTFDAGGAVLERTVMEIGQSPPSGARAILVVPGADVAVHWLHLPTRNPVQARAAARLTLQDRLSLPVEDAHVAIGGVEVDEHRICVVVGRSAMHRWLALARVYGVAAEVMVPDCLLLDWQEGEPVAVEVDGRIAVRGPRLAFGCEPELLEVLLPDRVAPVASAPEDVERLLVEGQAGPAINLMQGEFGAAADHGTDVRSFRRHASVLAAVALAAAAVLGVETWRYRSGAEKLQAAAVREADSVLPKGRPLGNPAVQARAHLSGLELAAGGGPVGAAASLFAAVESIEGAQLESLIASPEGVRAAVSHSNYSDVELLREAMRNAGFAFKEESTRDEGGRVMSDVLVGERL